MHYENMLRLFPTTEGSVLLRNIIGVVEKEVAFFSVVLLSYPIPFCFSSHDGTLYPFTSNKCAAILFEN